MDYKEARRVLSHIKYNNWNFILSFQHNSGMYLQPEWLATDIEDNELRSFKGRKWYISSHMTPSELVQTALKAVLTAQEHEVRENFLYKNQRIFGPHYDVEDLVELSKTSKDVRD